MIKRLRGYFMVMDVKVNSPLQIGFTEKLSSILDSPHTL